MHSIKKVSIFASQNNTYTHKKPTVMKETLSASIASQAFTIDKDAYEMLNAYLDNIRSRLDREDTETAADIEARAAEILRETLTSPIMVVTTAHVRKVMEQIGPPDIFGTKRDENSGKTSSENNCAEEQKTHNADSRKLLRSRENRLIAGVCGGIAEYFSLDVSVVRLLAVLLTVFGGMSIWVYIILWVVIPENN